VVLGGTTWFKRGTGSKKGFFGIFVSVKAPQGGEALERQFFSFIRPMNRQVYCLLGRGFKDPLNQEQEKGQ